MHNRIHTLRGERADLRGEVAGEVHDLDVGIGQAGDEVGFRTGAGGGDHPGAPGHGQLYVQRADPAGGAGDQHRLAAGHIQGDQAVEGRGPGKTQRAGVLHAQALGNPGETAGSRHGHVLGQRPAAQERLHDHPEDRVPDGEALHALTERLHGAREVLADHQRVPVLHHPLQPAGRRRGVEAVH
ncbi:hypothetical protein SVIOM74S_02114 [Streptomyces violarus]